MSLPRDIERLEPTGLARATDDNQTCGSRARSGSSRLALQRRPSDVRGEDGGLSNIRAIESAESTASHCTECATVVPQSVPGFVRFLAVPQRLNRRKMDEKARRYCSPGGFESQ